MIIKCIKPYIMHDKYTIGKLTVNNQYLVLDIEKDSCRIIDDDGVPACYPTDCFEIVENDLNHMVAYQNQFGISITHPMFINNKFVNRNINGFWVYLFETADPEAMDLVRKAIDELNSTYKLPIPPLSTY